MKKDFVFVKSAFKVENKTIFKLKSLLFIYFFTKIDLFL